MITQGAQFFGLSLLPSVAVSLMLNFTPIVVAVMSIFLIHEIPTARQWFGTVLFIGGILVYFLPVSFEGSEGLGILVMGIGVLANAGAAVLGRDINRSRKHTPLTITAISMDGGRIGSAPVTWYSYTGHTQREPGKYNSPFMDGSYKHCLCIYIMEFDPAFAIGNGVEYY
jgi:drug/metabolite transporter (DMT)-like permease